MIRFLLCTFTLFLPLQALAVEVLTSIKPIQLIVNELTQEVTTPSYSWLPMHRLTITL